MSYGNCLNATLFESHANNPKPKTGETVSRLELSENNCPELSLLENQKNNLASFILG